MVQSRRRAVMVDLPERSDFTVATNDGNVLHSHIR